MGCGKEKEYKGERVGTTELGRAGAEALKRLEE